MLYLRTLWPCQLLFWMFLTCLASCCSRPRQDVRMSGSTSMSSRSSWMMGPAQVASYMLTHRRQTTSYCCSRPCQDVRMSGFRLPCPLALHDREGRAEPCKRRFASEPRKGCTRTPRRVIQILQGVLTTPQEVCQDPEQGSKEAPEKAVAEPCKRVGVPGP